MLSFTQSNEFLGYISLINSGIYRPAPIFYITTDKHALGWKKSRLKKEPEPSGVTDYFFGCVIHDPSLVDLDTC